MEQSSLRIMTTTATCTFLPEDPAVSASPPDRPLLARCDALKSRHVLRKQCFLLMRTMHARIQSVCQSCCHRWQQRRSSKGSYVLLWQRQTGLLGGLARLSSSHRGRGWTSWLELWRVRLALRAPHQSIVTGVNCLNLCYVLSGAGPCLPLTLRDAVNKLSHHPTSVGLEWTRRTWSAVSWCIRSICSRDWTLNRILSNQRFELECSTAYRYAYASKLTADICWSRLRFKWHNVCTKCNPHTL